MTNQDDEGSLDQRLVHALGHPLRVEILRELEKGPSSPARLADHMEEKLSNVSYHTRVLLECDCIELNQEIPRRGAVEHIYRLKSQGARGARTWKEVPRSLRSHYAGTALADFATRAVGALDVLPTDVVNAADRRPVS
jgi:DNA-binding transcriptional ArsR family regulator